MTINFRRNFAHKKLYLTNQRHLNGMMHQQGAFSGIATYSPLGQQKTK
ncbi:hypothetical protein [Desulforamulus ruminis]|nr:hypothetical protein [Desulforamulus ruminis]